MSVGVNDLLSVVQLGNRLTGLGVDVEALSANSDLGRVVSIHADLHELGYA